MYIPSTPQVSEGVNPAQVLHEDDARGAERGAEGDVESSVAVQDGGCGSVQFQALEDGNCEREDVQIRTQKNVSGIAYV